MIVRNDAIAKALLDKELGLRLVPPFIGYAIATNAREVIGAVVFNSWTINDVQLTMCLKGPVSRADIRDVARVAFGAPLDVQRISCVTAASNVRARRAMEMLGFLSEGIAVDYFGRDKHGARYVLLRRNEKLSGLKHEQPASS